MSNVKYDSAYHTVLIRKVAAKMTKTLGHEVTEELVESLVKLQWLFLRNCIRGGAEVNLDKLGTFRLMTDRGDSKTAKYIRKYGGYPACIKPYETKTEFPENEVIYNPEFFPDLAINLTEDRGKNYNGMQRAKKRKPLFKGALTNRKKRSKG